MYTRQWLQSQKYKAKAKDLIFKAKAQTTTRGNTYYWNNLLRYTMEMQML